MVSHHQLQRSAPSCRCCLYTLSSTFLHLLLHVDFHEQRKCHNRNSNVRLRAEMVVEQHGRQEDAEHLPQRHDDCEHQRTVRRNYVEDENLTGS